MSERSPREAADALDAACKVMMPKEVYEDIHGYLTAIGDTLPADVHERDLALWHIAYRTIRSLVPRSDR